MCKRIQDYAISIIAFTMEILSFSATSHHAIEICLPSRANNLYSHCQIRCENRPYAVCNYKAEIQRRTVMDVAPNHMLILSQEACTELCIMTYQTY